MRKLGKPRYLSNFYIGMNITPAPCREPKILTKRELPFKWFDYNIPFQQIHRADNGVDRIAVRPLPDVNFAAVHNHHVFDMAIIRRIYEVWGFG